jgi:hypothetical protein
MGLGLWWREGFGFSRANHHAGDQFPMLGWVGQGTGANFRAACGLSIAGTEIWESVRRDGVIKPFGERQ